MRIVLFERSYKYLPSLKIPRIFFFIEVIGTCPKSTKAHFGPLGPLGVKWINCVNIEIMDKIDSRRKESIGMNYGHYCCMQTWQVSNKISNHLAGS